MNDLYSFVSNYTEPVTIKTVLFSLLLAFAMAQVIAATYVWTFRDALGLQVEAAPRRLLRYAACRQFRGGHIIP